MIMIIMKCLHGKVYHQIENHLEHLYSFRKRFF